MLKKMFVRPFENSNKKTLLKMCLKYKIILIIGKLLIIDGITSVSLEQITIENLPRKMAKNFTNKLV